MNHELQIERITPAVGAVIHGVDLAKPLSAELTYAIRQALLAHGVIFFRDQQLSAQQFEAFAEQFGEPTLPTSNIIPTLDGTRVISEVRKEVGSKTNVGGAWHTDQVYRSRPSWGTMLLSRKVPATGGDTLFANMSVAWDRLSDGLKKTLASMRAVHSNAGVHALIMSGREPDPEVSHPVMIRHPETGREILYVNPGYTTRFDGWTEAESKPLLAYLFQHAEHPEVTMRWRWQEGTVAFWDNYQSWHFAVNDYPSGERVMNRIVVHGPPFER